jgi:hypothetical protein
VALIIPPGKGGRLERAENVQLDAAGAGEVILGPVPSGQRWILARLAVFCTVDDPMPKTLVYRGPALPRYLIDGTYTGAQDFSAMDGVTPLEQDEYLTVVWSGGQPGAVATVSLTGAQVVV